MSLFILDTDILTHLERGEPNVVENVRRRSPQDLATTVITVEQKLAGWFGRVPGLVCVDWTLGVAVDDE